MGPVRPSWVDVDLGAVAHNVATLAAAVAPARLCAVVKADGYGHGDVPVAETALVSGADTLAVALVEEGVRLREAGIEAPILLLSEPASAAAGEVLKWHLTPTVYRTSFLEALDALAAEPLPVHLKVDTGMHRVGADPEECTELARRVGASRHLSLEAVWTHFAVAEEDLDYTRAQLSRLLDCTSQIERAGVSVPVRHAANTAAAILLEEARLDMVRVGLGIYGLRPAPHVGAELDLRPAMRVVSQVVMTRRLPAGARPSYGRRRPLPGDGTVVTVPVGYADGVPRLLAERGAEVLIRGRRFPLAGSVTMDQIVVDVAGEPVEAGDEVVLLGRQGEEAVTAEEWAQRLGTINYEIVCQIGPRMPRRYLS